MKHELAAMRAQGSGAIVNCPSLGGLVGLPGRAAYHASKHGVIGLTTSAAREYAPRGIRINAVCPGTFATPMVDDMIAKGELDHDQAVANQPIGRLGRPDESAAAVLWLCSPGASFSSESPFPSTADTPLNDGGPSRRAVTSRTANPGRGRRSSARVRLFSVPYDPPGEGFHHSAFYGTPATGMQRRGVRFQVTRRGGSRPASVTRSPTHTDPRACMSTRFRVALDPQACECVRRQVSDSLIKSAQTPISSVQVSSTPIGQRGVTPGLARVDRQPAPPCEACLV
jgi:hypothetical protein